MFPIPTLTWIKIGIVIAAIVFAYFKGYSSEHEKFIRFQAETAAVGKAQELANQNIEREHQIVNTGIKNSYEARLAAVNGAYSVGVQHAGTGGGNVPTISIAPARVIKIASDPEFVGRCAQTTVQLITLQDWVRQNLEVK